MTISSQSRTERVSDGRSVFKYGVDMLLDSNRTEPADITVNYQTVEQILGMDFLQADIGRNSL